MYFIQVNVAKVRRSDAFFNGLLGFLVSHACRGHLACVEELRAINSGLANGSSAFKFVSVILSAVDLQRNGQIGNACCVGFCLHGGIRAQWPCGSLSR
jgi:hypothetical protein